MGEFPNKATQFPANRKDHTQKGPYLTPLIKKFLSKKLTYVDPDTKKKICRTAKNAIIWKLISNSAKGELGAIKEILERIDGKVAEKIESTVRFTQMGNIKVGGKPLNIQI